MFPPSATLSRGNHLNLFLFISSGEPNIYLNNVMSLFPNLSALIRISYFENILYISFPHFSIWITTFHLFILLGVPGLCQVITPYSFMQLHYYLSSIS